MKINNKEKMRRAGAVLLALILSLTSISAGAASPDSSAAGDTASTAVAAEIEEELPGYKASDDNTGSAAGDSTEFSTDGSTESVTDSVAATPGITEEDPEEEQSEHEPSDESGESATDTSDSVPSMNEENAEVKDTGSNNGHDDEISDGSYNQDTDIEVYESESRYDDEQGTVTGSLPNELLMSNAEENKQKALAGEEMDPMLEVYLSRKDDFPEDGDLLFHILKGEELVRVLEEAGEYFQDYEIEPLLPLTIGVFKKDSTLSEEFLEEYTGLGPLTVRIYMEDTDFLDQNYLLHKAEDKENEENKWEALSYVLYEKTETTLPYVEFKTENLSDFLFVTLSEKHIVEDAGTVDEEETDEAAKDDAQVKEDPADQEDKDISAKAENEITTPKFDHRYPCSDDIENMDFSLCRIFIATSDPSVLEGVENYSEYNGLYLLTFSTEEETKNAYTYFFNVCDFVEVDEAVVSIAAGDTDDKNETADTADTENEVSVNNDPDTTDADTIDDGNDGLMYEAEDSCNGALRDEASSSVDMSTADEAAGDTVSEDKAYDGAVEEKSAADNGGTLGTDAITVLNELTESSQDIEDGGSFSNSKKIAVVDTGASEQRNVIKRVSVIGDTADDDNGHGDDMISYILSQDPDAEILSIKALDADGVGHVSDLYAAIEYAVSEGADIINLSVSARMSEGSEVISRAVKDAVDSGIIVVGAAGNNNKNAQYYIPGGLKDVIVTGACNQKGKKVSTSNFGDTVDYNIVAETTSEAAARLSGFISKNGVEGIKNVLDNVLIYNPDYTAQEDTENGLEDDTLVHTAYSSSKDNVPKTPDSADDRRTYQAKKAKPASVTVTGIYKTVNYKYSSSSSNDSKDYWEEVLGHTKIMNVTDSNGNSGKAVCVDPYMEGATSGTTYSNIWTVDCASIMKTLYYGLVDTSGIDYIVSKGDAGTRDKWVLIHYALCYYAMANNLITNSGFENDTHGESNTKSYVAFWRWTSTRLRSDVAAFMAHVDAKPMPEGYSAYMIYPNAGNFSSSGKQCYIYLAEKSGVTFHKSSTNENYEPSLAGAQYWVYDTYDHARSEGDVGYKGKIYDSDSNGRGSSWLDLSPGTYHMIESNDHYANTYYNRSSQIYEFTVHLGEYKTVEVKNEPKLAKIKVEKSSSVSSEILNKLYYSLSGAQFEVYSTKTAAQGRINNLNAGNNTRPSGYMGDQYLMTIGSENVSNEVSIIPGTYYVVESKAPTDGKHKRSTTVYTATATTPGGTAVVKATDDADLGYLKLKKSSTIEGYTESMKGAQYRIYNSSANAAARNGGALIYYDTITIKDDGTSDAVALFPGTYYMIETSAPENGLYKLSDEVHEIKIQNNHTTTKPLLVQVYDEPKNPYAPLKIKKVVTGNMGNRYKQFSFTVTLKNSDNTAYNKSLTYQKGATTGTLTPDAQGKISFTLANDEVIELKNILFNSKYTVSENDYSSEGYVKASVNETGTIKAQNADVVFTNTKNTTVVTGIDVKLTTGLGLILIAASAFVIWKKIFPIH